MTMKERRIVPRRPALMMGVIIFSERAPRIQCKVTDISEIGAGLEISTTVDIPQEFDLVVEGIRRRCRFVGRGGTRIVSRKLHGQSRWLGTLQYLVDVVCRAMKTPVQIDAVTDEPSRLDMLAISIDCG